jgi:hypothetical protein
MGSPPMMSSADTDRAYPAKVDYDEGHAICFSLQLLSTNKDFLLDLHSRLKGNPDEGAFGMFEHYRAATVALLKLFVGVKGLLISEAELRQIGRANDPAEQIRLLS